MLLNIDYLIINLKGHLTNYTNNIFTLERQERGTKNFQNVYNITYKNLKIGTLLNAPYQGSVLAPDFNQLQFENHLFYTISKNELKNILFEFLLNFNLQFDSINRLDICVDVEEEENIKNLYHNIFNKKILLKGREKHITTHSISNNGNLEITGLSIGKRTNSRYLRIYNKTKYLQVEPKKYISNWHNENNLKNVWRFEYQLNNKFFKDLNRTNGLINEPITWAIFELEYLKELFFLAKKNHFEIKENTGKTEVNKEKDLQLFDFEKITITEKIIKIKERFENKTIGIKRTIKTLFSEYAKTFQTDLEFIIPLNKLLENYSLKTWFYSKYKYYLSDIKTRSKQNIPFNEVKFFNDLELCI